MAADKPSARGAVTHACNKLAGTEGFPMATWLLAESKALDDEAQASIETALKFANRTTRSIGSTLALALRMNDVVIHDTKKWFGQPSASFYQPTTFRFPSVHDGDRLPIESPGLIFFYGQPRARRQPVAASSAEDG
jgi:cobalamin biosynthesis protein CbiG